MKGKIVILNGTSCSGKSTTARTLQELMPEPYMHVGLDHFEKMQPKQGWGYNQVFYGEGLGNRDLIPVMHTCIAHMAEEGVNVVVEHILLKRRWLKDAVERIAEFDPLFVGVWCPTDELLKREGERNRPPGTSQIERHFKQIEALLQIGVYDMVVDTTKETPEQCVESIIQHLNENGGGTMFKSLIGNQVFESDEEFWR